MGLPGPFATFAPDAAAPGSGSAGSHVISADGPFRPEPLFSVAIAAGRIFSRISLSDPLRGMPRIGAIPDTAATDDLVAYITSLEPD